MLILQFLLVSYQSNKKKKTIIKLHVSGLEVMHSGSDSVTTGWFRI